MKNIVARALVTPSVGPFKTDTEFQEIQKEFQLIQFHIQQHNARLGHIEKHIPCLPQTEFPSSSAKDPTPMDSFDE